MPDDNQLHEAIITHVMFRLQRLIVVGGRPGAAVSVGMTTHNSTPYTSFSLSPVTEFLG